jgi:hypothetical protein
MGSYLRRADDTCTGSGAAVARQERERHQQTERAVDRAKFDRIRRINARATELGAQLARMHDGPTVTGLPRCFIRHWTPCARSRGTSSVTEGVLSTNELAEVYPREKPLDIIAGVEQFLRSYLVLPEKAYFPLALWIAATSLADAFECFPYLALLSPEKRCGKTRLLEALEVLCAKSWRGTAPTSAALYRMMQQQPTLLMDEVEALRSKHVSETQQNILAVLNAGHRRGATVPRCVGNDHKLVYFPVYGSKAFAIGRLPDTLADRSIIMTMQRRTAEQRVNRFLFNRAKAEASPIVTAITNWAQERREDVRDCYESSPDLLFLSDRDADLWLPLFAFAASQLPTD